jgi:hypothetical protein
VDSLIVLIPDPDADPDPTFHFDAGPDPDPKSDPGPTPGFTNVKIIKIFSQQCLVYIVLSFSSVS